MHMFLKSAPRSASFPATNFAACSTLAGAKRRRYPINMLHRPQCTTLNSSEPKPAIMLVWCGKTRTATATDNSYKNRNSSWDGQDRRSTVGTAGTWPGQPECVANKSGECWAESDRGSNNLILHCKCKQILLSRRENLNRSAQQKRSRRQNQNAKPRGGSEQRKAQDATVQGTVVKVSECLFYGRHRVGFTRFPTHNLQTFCCCCMARIFAPAPGIGLLLLKNYYVEWQAKLPMQAMSSSSSSSSAFPSRGLIAQSARTISLS